MVNRRIRPSAGQERTFLPRSRFHNPSPVNILKLFYTEAVFRPLLNGLIFIYAVLPYHDIGLAIIALTAVVRLLLHPALVQSIRSQEAMIRLQPRLREIQSKLRDDKEEQARATMALYREEGVHPLSGCIPILIQLPVLIGLYQVFLRGIAHQDLSLIYLWLAPVLNGGSLNHIAFGFFDLTQKSVVLAVAAGISQFFQARFMPQAGNPASPKKNSAADFASAVKFQTTYFLPVFIAAISFSLPSALAFYWTILNLFAILQQRWIEKRLAYERTSRSNHPNP